MDAFDLGRWALVVCALVAVALLVPIGLASVGFGAILAVADGARASSANTVGTAGQGPVNETSATAGLQSESVIAAPIASVIVAGHGLVAGLSARGPLDQYARANYCSDQSWLAWHNADCSAAALAWLLGAYGQQLGSLDHAIALVGPGTGISARLGLLDARGPALARALAARGLRPRQPRRSDGQLALRRGAGHPAPARRLRCHQPAWRGGDHDDRPRQRDHRRRGPDRGRGGADGRHPASRPGHDRRRGGPDQRDRGHRAAPRRGAPGPQAAGRVRPRYAGQEVVEEERKLEVPVSREEAYVEHRPVEPRPADRPVGEAADQTIEVPVREERVETSKQPVEYEEVGVGKQQVTRTQPVSDTVRREELRIQREGDVQLSGAGAAASWEQAMPTYRQRWQQHAGTTGGRWEDVESGYRYGWELRNRPENRGRAWSDIESQAQRDWATHNPATPWERARDSVRDAWDTATS